MRWWGGTGGQLRGLKDGRVETDRATHSVEEEVVALNYSILGHVVAKGPAILEREKLYCLKWPGHNSHLLHVLCFTHILGPVHIHWNQNWTHGVEMCQQVMPDFFKLSPHSYGQCCQGKRSLCAGGYLIFSLFDHLGSEQVYTVGFCIRVGSNVDGFGANLIVGGRIVPCKTNVAITVLKVYSSEGCAELTFMNFS